MIYKIPYECLGCGTLITEGEYCVDCRMQSMKESCEVEGQRSYIR